VRLAGVVQIFPFGQRQAESRLGIDVGRHDLSSGRRRTDLRQSHRRAEDPGGGDEEADDTQARAHEAAPVGRLMRGIVAYLNATRQAFLSAGQRLSG
jgi:hypothetical protein